MFPNNIDKNSREYLQRRLSGARTNLLLVIAFTVINLVLLLTDSGRYFLFSASVPYELTFLGAVINYQETGAIMGTYTYTALVISAVILAVYLLSWLFSKKRTGWYIVALVMFSLDTLVLILLNLDILSECILDIILHAYVIFDLVQAILAGKKLKTMPIEAVAAPAAAPVYTPAEEPWNRKDAE